MDSQFDDADPIILEGYKTNIIINNKSYNIHILDSYGGEEYHNMMDMWVSFEEGFLLVFSIEYRESFERLEKTKERIIKGKHGAPVPMILVGNKQDLENERKVSYEEAKQLADSWGIDYIETSAKTNSNCIEAFEAIIIKVISTKNKPKKSSCCNCLIF